MPSKCVNCGHNDVPERYSLCDSCKASFPGDSDLLANMEAVFESVMKHLERDTIRDVVQEP